MLGPDEVFAVEFFLKTVRIRLMYLDKPSVLSSGRLDPCSVDIFILPSKQFPLLLDDQLSPRLERRPKKIKSSVDLWLSCTKYSLAAWTDFGANSDGRLIFPPKPNENPRKFRNLRKQRPCSVCREKNNRTIFLKKIK